MNEKEILKLKKGDIFYSARIVQSLGSWNISISKILVEKKNRESLRINNVKANGEKCDSYRVGLDKLKEKACSYFNTKKSAIEHIKKLVINFNLSAKKSIEQYTEKHPSYDFYKYSLNISNDFVKLMESGYTEEKEIKIHEKYKEYEDAAMRKAFGI